MIKPNDATILLKIKRTRVPAKKLSSKKEGKVIKKEAEEKGFEEGLKRWNEQLVKLEEEIASARADMEKTLLPLTMAAIKKILGRELEVHPETIVDIVANALKTVAQHRKIIIYVKKSDLDVLESARPRLKALFENLQSLSIVPKEDVQEGSCVIETERGILNVSLENQLKAIEGAFHAALKKEDEGGTP